MLSIDEIAEQAAAFSYSYYGTVEGYSAALKGLGNGTITWDIFDLMRDFYLDAIETCLARSIDNIATVLYKFINDIELGVYNISNIPYNQLGSHRGTGSSWDNQFETYYPLIGYIYHGFADLNSSAVTATIADNLANELHLAYAEFKFLADNTSSEFKGVLLETKNYSNLYNANIVSTSYPNYSPNTSSSRWVKMDVTYYIKNYLTTGTLSIQDVKDSGRKSTEFSSPIITLVFKPLNVVDFKVDGVTYETQHIEWNKSPMTPPAPSKPGYVFKGWSVDQVNAVNLSTYKIKDNITFHALFGGNILPTPFSATVVGGWAGKTDTFSFNLSTMPGYINSVNPYITIQGKLQDYELKQSGYLFTTIWNGIIGLSAAKISYHLNGSMLIFEVTALSLCTVSFDLTAIVM